MRQPLTKAFTLIELLVVVAIIGILAAVGVVAYNGYTKSAKANSVKTIHQQTVKYLKAETMKCNMGASTIMGGLSCSGLTTDKITAHIGDFTGKVLDFKNPYFNDGMLEYAVGRSSRWWNGGVAVSATGNKLMLKTCTTISCPQEDQMYSEVIID